MDSRNQNRPTSAVANPGRGRVMGVLSLVALMATGLALSGCNTTAGAGQDVSATGAAVTRGANDVKRGL